MFLGGNFKLCFGQHFHTLCFCCAIRCFLARQGLFNGVLGSLSYVFTSVLTLSSRLASWLVSWAAFQYALFLNSITIRLFWLVFLYQCPVQNFHKPWFEQNFDRMRFGSYFLPVFPAAFPHSIFLSKNIWLQCFILQDM